MEKNLYDEARLTISEIIEKAKLNEGNILVIGCSTSEIVGSKIGTNSAPKLQQRYSGRFMTPQKSTGFTSPYSAVSTSTEQ